MLLPKQLRRTSFVWMTAPCWGPIRHHQVQSSSSRQPEVRQGCANYCFEVMRDFLSIEAHQANAFENCHFINDGQ